LDYQDFALALPTYAYAEKRWTQINAVLHL